MKTILLSIAFLTIFSFAFAQQKINNGFAHERGKKIERLAYNPVPDGEHYTIAVVVGDDVEIWVAGTPMQKGTFQKTGHKEIYDLEYTPDGKYLLTVGKDNVVRVWNTKTFKKERELFGHKDEIYSIAMDPRGKYFATSSEDEMVKLWDLKTFEEINTFFNHREPVKKVSFSPDGKLLASLGETGKIMVREIPLGIEVKEVNIPGDVAMNMEFAIAENTLLVGGEKGSLRIFDFSASASSVQTLMSQVKEKVNVISFSYDGKYAITGYDDGTYITWDLKSLIMFDKGEFKGEMTSLEFNPNGKQLGATGDEKNFYDITFMGIKPKTLVNSSDNASPQVLLTSPKFKGETFSTDLSRVQISGLVTDDESGVYSLFINGIDAYTGNDQFSLQVDLKYGINPVVIEAKDAAGNIRELKYNFKREDLGGDGFGDFFAESTNHLLIIAADQYKNWTPLTNAVSDAEQVKEVLQEKYDFKDENTIFIKNDEVTRQGVIDAFAQMVKKVKPSDNLLIYYSGHGDFDPIIKEGYWVPVDGDQKQRTTFISNSELKKYISAVNSRHTFLVADACFSGSLFESGTRGSYLENMEKLKSRWGLTAGSLEEVSDGNSGESSPFCKAFIEYLKNPPEDEFPVGDLVQFVKRKVADKTEQQPQGNPLSGVGDEGGQFIFRKTAGF